MYDEEKKLDEKIESMFKDLKETVHSTLNILVLGKVSAGKSSFLNAFFDCEKSNPKFEVGAQSGVTTKVKYQMIGKNIKIADTPGLDDIKQENSNETLKMIEEGVDIGILLLSGSADKSQRVNYENLKINCKKVFVVLKKSDEFSKQNLQIVLNQWKEQLGLSDKIYPIVSRGYDRKDKLKDPVSLEEFEVPIDNYGRPKTLKNIDDLRDDILSFLEKYGKDIILAKELKIKSKKALAIIASACVGAGTSALIPGSALYIGAFQAVAISSLAYLYTGKLLDKSQAISVIGVFAAQTVGTSLFLLIKSFLPPTGIIDLAAVVVAVAITAAMLLVITKMFENGYSLDDKDKMITMFKDLLPQVKELIKTTNISDLKDSKFYTEKLMDLLKRMK